MKYFVSLILITVVLSVSGCGDGKLDGFPAKLLTCRVTVSNGDEPMGNVSVSFLPDNERQKYTMVAMTDANGVANMRTTLAGYYGTGVPEGTYKVLIIGSEDPELEHTLTMDERMELSPDALDAYERARQKRINALPIGEVPTAIAKELSKTNTTPLTWSVDRKGAEFTVNVAEYKEARRSR